MKGSCKRTAPSRVVHMLKCNLGLPDGLEWMLLLNLFSLGSL